MLFKNKFRVETIRHQEWDYSREGFYFVTICTKDKVNLFGEIKGGKMVLNKLGEIVKNEWSRTKIIRKNVELDEFIVMPNHIHGIIVIEYNINNVETHGNASLGNVGFETHGNASLREGYKNKFGPQSNNLSAILRGFKGASVKTIRKEFPDINFSWQERFYDRIIRDENELSKIRQYIFDNPLKWELDKNNSENLYM